ncbi:hypothetical protein K491DRAFT_573800, partial [Lophiostoma macrostomum CBS 122681]
TVKLLVGDAQQQEEFIVHEHIITTRSKFFEAALKDAWKEAEERVIKLPEDDPEVVLQYVRLLYGQNMSFKVAPDSKFASTVQAAFFSKSELLCKLYVFGEKMQDLRLKNTAMEAMHATWTPKQSDGSIQTPGFSSVGVIYEGTPGPCPPRRLLVQLY